MIVCIDPGHGHSNRTMGVFDPGAVHAGVREADVVMQWADALKRECLRRHWMVVMTRHDNDEPMPLVRRVPFARMCEASCLVSIHCNAAGVESAHGIETYYLHSDRLAKNIQQALVDALGLADRGAKRSEELAILRYPHSALVEVGFLSNENDRAVITDVKHIADGARAIADGIARGI